MLRRLPCTDGRPAARSVRYSGERRRATCRRPGSSRLLPRCMRGSLSYVSRGGGRDGWGASTTVRPAGARADSGRGTPHPPARPARPARPEQPEQPERPGRPGPPELPEPAVPLRTTPAPTPCVPPPPGTGSGAVCRPCPARWPSRPAAPCCSSRCWPRRPRSPGRTRRTSRPGRPGEPCAPPRGGARCPGPGPSSCRVPAPDGTRGRPGCWAGPCTPFRCRSNAGACRTRSRCWRPSAGRGRGGRPGGRGSRGAGSRARPGCWCCPSPTM